jgi:small subunit ribosomal protein S14
MAKISSVVKNNKRKHLAEKFKAKRLTLTKMIADPNLGWNEKLEAQKKLHKLPKDSSKVRHRNRCEVTGRPRAYYRQFGISRIALRELGLQGLLPGVTKSSW